MAKNSKGLSPLAEYLEEGSAGQEITVLCPKSYTAT